VDVLVPALDPMAGQVLDLIGPRASTLSELARRTGLDARVLLVAVSVLEERGLVQRTSDGISRRAARHSYHQPLSNHTTR
jgi:DNA-binding IclR family transcriptional regulator